MPSESDPFHAKRESLRVNEIQPNEAMDAVAPEDRDWRPSALQAWWAGLPQTARSLLRKRLNRDNQTRLHLAHLVARRPGQVVIGAYTYGRPKVRFPESGATLVIGRYGSIADGVEILLGGNHRLDWATTYPFPALPRLWPAAAGRTGHDATRGDVVIGHDVWLGSQCMVMSGVSIGHGAVVAARAVVTRDVPPYAIVAGNPARIIRLRFDEATVSALLDTQWWNLPKPRIETLLPLLLSDRIDAFVAAVRRP
jgi:acetyltransferase-like isoleucine patch superfamily enzyme